MQTYDVRVSTGTGLFILDLDTRLRPVVSLTPQSLYPHRKIPQYPVKRRVHGSYSLSGSFGEEKRVVMLDLLLHFHGN
jgi:hypothetical protein